MYYNSHVIKKASDSSLYRRLFERMIVLKRLVSVLCILTLAVGMFAVCAVGASAAEAAQTELSVSEGDTVNYILTLGGVSTPIIGCDFSVYYDSSLFSVESVADFTGSTDDSDWEALINPDLDGEVRGNWSILKGVDFKNAKAMLTVNLKAKKSGSGHISYFIRYMYDDSIFPPSDKENLTKEELLQYTVNGQIRDYQLTCDVLVNGKPVAEKSQPELNVEESQKSGYFVNSVTGDSKDADPEIPKTAAQAEVVIANRNTNIGSGSNDNGGSGDNNDANPGANSNDNNSGNESDDKNNTADNENKTNDNNDSKKEAPLGTDAEGNIVIATDAQGNITATADSAQTESGGSPLVWIIIAALVVLAGGGVAAYVISNKKKAASGGADNTVGTDNKE